MTAISSARRKSLIADDDTAKSLHLKSAQASAALLDEVLPKIKKGQSSRTPQDHSKATYFGGRKPADGEIDWNMGAAEIRNLVRATTRPYPGAFSFIGDTKCFMWAVSELPESGQKLCTRHNRLDRSVGCCLRQRTRFGLISARRKRPSI